MSIRKRLTNRGRLNPSLSVAVFAIDHRNRRRRSEKLKVCATAGSRPFGDQIITLSMKMAYSALNSPCRASA